MPAAHGPTAIGRDRCAEQIQMVRIHHFITKAASTNISWFANCEGFAAHQMPCGVSAALNKTVMPSLMGNAWPSMVK